MRTFSPSCCSLFRGLKVTPPAAQPRCVRSPRSMNACTWPTQHVSASAHAVMHTHSATLRALATLNKCVHVAHAAYLCKRACSDAPTFSHAACARHAQ
eukprot:1064203-Pelagomonas_calceolata.AAC.1